MLIDNKKNADAKYCYTECLPTKNLGRELIVLSNHFPTFLDLGRKGSSTPFGKTDPST
jgi:hypothetical protein